MCMANRSLSLIALIALVGSLAAMVDNASGQTTSATLSGAVRDVAGSVVPGAKISVRNIQTGATRESAADTQGRYVLTNLEPGSYELRAEQSGFKRAVRSGLILTVGASVVADLTLE